MALAAMLKECRNELICDMAEYYGIYDMKSLPASTIAILACGLREESRVIQKMSNMKVKTDTILLASIADRVGLLIWAQSKDGQHNRHRPKSVVDSLLNDKKENKQKLETNTFDTIDDYMIFVLQKKEG